MNEIIIDEIDAIENETLLESYYDKAEYDDSEDDEVEVTPMEVEEERVTHVEAKGAVYVLRKYMSSREMPQDCFMTLARLQRKIVQQ